ncbi:DUF262 domain-containing protein [Luteolibacter yonseiensis]
MLNDEITKAQRHVRTDAYQMSIGEIVSMYERDEITIDPDFQRLFRWEISQKSKLIESILLGIPLPSIFVFETAEGEWELIDGLQRISTIFEFMGILRDESGKLRTPSILDGTKYLPSLHNVVWEKSPEIAGDGIDESDQIALDKAAQLAIRRGRLGVEILKRPSDNQTKFDLFQRLNAGGTQANAQELRNCIMVMSNRHFFDAVRSASETRDFLEVMNVSKEQIRKQRNMEFAVRFLVHVNMPYDGKLDVEEYIDDGIVKLANKIPSIRAFNQITQTYKLLKDAAGKNALRKFTGSSHTGKVGLVGLEAIAVGVGKNLKRINNLPSPADFVRSRIEEFWSQPDLSKFTSLGLRGTTRIQRTVDFGKNWFAP